MIKQVFGLGFLGIASRRNNYANNIK